MSPMPVIFIRLGIVAALLLVYVSIRMMLLDNMDPELNTPGFLWWWTWAMAAPCTAGVCLLIFYAGRVLRWAITGKIII